MCKQQVHSTQVYMQSCTRCCTPNTHIHNNMMLIDIGVYSLLCICCSMRFVGVYILSVRSRNQTKPKQKTIQVHIAYIYTVMIQF